MVDRVARISERTQWTSPHLHSGDADRLRASQLQHAVQNRDADVHLGGLTLVRARVQPVADHPFEAANRCLGQGTAIVAGGCLPAHAAVLGDELQVLIPLGRGCLGCFVVLAHMIQEGALESVRMAPVAKFWRSRLVRHIGRLCSCGSEGPGANSRSSICESEQTRQMAILHTFAVTRPYWDGGYSANPPVIALVEASDASDMLIVQIMPTAGQELPVS